MKNKKTIIEELKLAISVLKTQEKNCGFNHLGVKVCIHNCIRLVRKLK